MFLRCLYSTLLVLGALWHGAAVAATVTTQQGQNPARPLLGAPANAPDAVADQILVGFRAGVDPATRGAAHLRIGARVLRRLTGIGVDLVSVQPGTAPASMRAYRGMSAVRFAEPNHLRRLTGHLPSEGIEPWPYGGGNIDFMQEQWGLHNTGQLFYYDEIDGSLGALQGAPDADIDFAEAWHRLDGQAVDDTVVIAVLDSGVDCTNVDLAPKCIHEQNFGPSADGHNDIIGHGTHVAATAAAATNNGVGVAGVGWNAKVADLKVCYEEYDWLFGIVYGLCADADIAEGLVFAADQGYEVANMSIAGAAASQTVQDAVDYSAGAGMVLVAGAGNAYTQQPMYPAAYGPVISVGATDHFDNLTSFSSFGAGTVQLLAPGLRILSAISVEACGAPDCFGWNSGTSMATPHVAGAAALVWGRMRALGLAPTNTTVRDILESSADTTGALGQNFLAWASRGRLNLDRAIAQAEGSAPPPPPPGGGSTVHVSDLDASSVNQGGTWRAAVTVALDDEAHAPLSGATVTGQWSGGASGTATCTTSGNGRCTVQSASIPKRVASTTFTVTGATVSGRVYVAADNHDPDGDSDGTIIVVGKP